jgi:hypothetical protein
VYDFLKENGFFHAVVAGVVGLFFAIAQKKLLRDPPNGAPASGGIGAWLRQWWDEVKERAANPFVAAAVLTCVAVGVFSLAGGWEGDPGPKVWFIRIPGWLIVPGVLYLFSFLAVLIGKDLGEGAVTKLWRRASGRAETTGALVGVAVLSASLLFVTWTVAREVLYDAVFARGLAARDVDTRIALWTRAIELRPGRAAPYHNRGLAYARKGEYDRVIADYTRAIELDPKYAQTYALRGSEYQLKQDYVRAIADFNRVLELDPNSTDALWRRANAYEALGDTARAEADRKRASEHQKR